MKPTKLLRAMAFLALALMAFAGTASATTLEVGGVKKTETVTFHATLEASAILQDTGGFFANTCTESTMHGWTIAPFTTTTGRTGGPTQTLTFSKCTEEPVVVDAAGSFTIEWIKGTTNGTVFWDSLKVTSPSPFGALTCTTSSTGTHIGVLTGKRSTTEHATMDINAVTNCGFFLPSARWEARYLVTSPTGLGVTE